MKIKVGILGATGYTGAQLLAVLLNHPNTNIVWVTSERFFGKKIKDVFPHLSGFIDLSCAQITQVGELSKVDLVFSCLPNGASMIFTKKFTDKGVRVIDLSADFRLKDLSFYKEFYGFEHKCPELLENATYGLPELNKEKIVNAVFTANGGCYATGVILGLIPVVNILEYLGDIVVDIKSPVSGAGRAPRLGNHFTEINENIKVDGFGGNIQKYEISQSLKVFCKVDVNLIFVNSKLPINRGVMSVSYLKLKDSIELEKIFEIYRNFYTDCRFVRVYESGIPKIKSTRGSNFCDIGFGLQDDFLIVVTVLDNLIKGAAGQAVQNMNLMYGFKESAGLDFLTVFP